jgi:hypothetical protein
VELIVVRYDQALDVLRESHRARGVGSAIVISAGFAERGVDDRTIVGRTMSPKLVDEPGKTLCNLIIPSSFCGLGGRFRLPLLTNTVRRSETADLVV